MVSIRKEVLSGVAALSLIGLVQTARAEDRWPANSHVVVEHNAAQDGRGETAEFRATASERALPKPATEKPQPSFIQKERPPPPLRTDIQVRLGEGKDRVALPTAARPAPAEEKTAGVIKQQTRIPLKSEVVVRLSEMHADDSNAAVTASGKDVKSPVQHVRATRTATLRALPLKAEIKMRLNSTGSDAGDKDEL